MSTASAQPPAAPARGHRKTRIGLVVSNKMQKTIIVRVDRLVQHEQYGRTMRNSNKFKAHDEHNSAAIGDWVRIMETRPLSKDKRWRLVEVLKRAPNAPALADDAIEELIRRKPKARPAAAAPPQGSEPDHGERPEGAEP
jgi:small subunit ribosomal protein S17